MSKANRHSYVPLAGDVGTWCGYTKEDGMSCAKSAGAEIHQSPTRNQNPVNAAQNISLPASELRAGEADLDTRPGPPGLCDRGDGVHGHYCIGRLMRRNEIYREYWNNGVWCSAGEIFLGEYRAQVQLDLINAHESAQGCCTWTEDSDGAWDTSCQNAYQFIEGGPKNNSAAFCLYCGKAISEVRFAYEDDDESAASAARSIDRDESSSVQHETESSGVSSTVHPEEDQK